MPNNDLFDSQVSPDLNIDPPASQALPFDQQAFSDFFPPENDLGYEFEADETCIYTAPTQGVQLPVFDEEPENQPEPVPQEEEPESLLDNIDFTSSDLTTAPDDQEAEDESPDQGEPEMTLDIQEESPKKGHHVFHIIANALLGFLTVFSLLYLIVVYSSNSVVVGLRNMYIQTAMSTLNHKYLATAIFPSDMIDDLMRMQYESENAMLGVETQWGDLDIKALPTFENAINETPETVEEDIPESAVAQHDEYSGPVYESQAEETFFNLFYEIDYDSMQSYLEEHPQVLDEGWANIVINRSALGDEGTSIQTIYGDQVLALNAQEGVVLVRVNIDYSRGVFAICKDTSKLHLRAASTIGSIGQTAGRICDANGGILAITGSAFVDQNGEGNGGEISGLAICSGTAYGSPIWSNYKRVEFRSDNKMYIMDSGSEVSSDVRDAVEFTPALIIDGNVVVDDNCGWTSPNPRSAIGQTAYLETVLAVIEGRFSDSPGCSVVTLAEKMAQYGCVQAMNMDGGTSAIMYYDGYYVTRCSNSSLPSGRPMPTAWVYG